MRLYLVWDAETISEQTDVIVESIFQSVDADTDDEKQCSKPSKKKKKAKKSSSSDDGSSSESSSAKAGSYARCYIMYR